MVAVLNLWNEEEVRELRTLNIDEFAPLDPQSIMSLPIPTQGTTGFIDVPSNNYPFYSAEEKYRPVMQQDGGQLSEWKRMYEPSAEQAEKDKRTAFTSGIPHGSQQDESQHISRDQITLKFESDSVNAQGGELTSFELPVSPAIRIVDLHRLIADKVGIAPGLQRLSYAGKDFNDAQRTLHHYGVAYWHSKFPHWPIRITWR